MTTREQIPIPQDVVGSLSDQTELLLTGPEQGFGLLSVGDVPTTPVIPTTWPV